MKFNFLYFLIILTSFILALFLYSALNENLFFSPYYGIGSGSGSGQVCIEYSIKNFYIPEDRLLTKKFLEVELDTDATNIDDTKNIKKIQESLKKSLDEGGLADFLSEK